MKIKALKLKKKLCFVVTDAISFNVLYREQLEYLTDNEFNLTLICGGVESELNNLRERKVGRVINLSFVREPNLWFDLLGLLRLIWHFLFNRYDLVVSTTPKALLLGSLAAFLTFQKRRVTFFQGRVYESFNGFKRKFYTFLDRIVIFCSKEVLFVSDSLMEEFINDIPFVVRKAQVIGNGSGNGVDAEKFSPQLYSKEENDTLRKTLGIHEDDFVVLSVGRICIDKGIKELVDVANLVTEKAFNVRFLLVGAIEDEEAFKISSELISKGIIIHVDFVKDIVPYFALANLHLFLSHREGFGNVAIEAAAMGIPTYAFDVVGVRNSVAEGVSGLRFKLGDSVAVANSIIKFIKEPDGFKNQFLNSRTWAIENFSNKTVWENYRKYYRS